MRSYCVFLVSLSADGSGMIMRGAGDSLRDVGVSSSSLNTTQCYIETNLDAKRRVVEVCL